MSSIVEIIEFKQPDYIDNTLYVCGMKGRYDEIQLAAKLNDTFSRFGLLYNVQVHVGKLIAINEEEDDNETPIKSYYAFVKYYSHNAAVQARRIMNGRTLMDQALFVSIICDPKRSVDPNQYYLGLNRCQELANYYLGFNSWSSSITSMMQDCDDITSIDNTTNMRYICICKLKIIKYNIECEGIGIGETQYHIKGWLYYCFS
ncbi:RAD52 motif-containing protein 1-like [Saccoglossus kowalevskii]